MDLANQEEADEFNLGKIERELRDHVENIECYQIILEKSRDAVRARILNLCICIFVLYHCYGSDQFSDEFPLQSTPCVPWQRCSSPA
jgi:hypothetical protein